jgi:leucyl aminopeptidase
MNRGGTITMVGLNVSVSSAEPWASPADALIVSLFEDELTDGPFGGPEAARLAALDQRLQGMIHRLAALGEQPGKLFRTTLLPAGGEVAAPRVLLIGAGARSDYDRNRARRVAGAAIRALGRSPVATAAGWFRGGEPGPFAEALATGAMLGSFDPAEYRTASEEPRAPMHQLTLLVESGEAAAAAAARRGQVVGDATNLARHLANAPGNLLTPQKLAQEAGRAGSADGFAVDVLDRDRMAALGMGALLGVAEGSEQPPAMIVMTYRGRGGDGYDLGLIGKGVTFDTGGISIKPAAEMHLMREDMAGAAATVGAMSAIARLGVRANVLGLVPAVENMPSGHAMRPGDVLTAMNGKTIEVLNTDAEGRLILADAVVYAQRLGARRLIDAATLTGAVVVALGHQAAGLLGTPDDWVARVQQASSVAGERVWPLPLYPEYAEQLKSDLADVANVGGRAAGTITGAMFIRQFVEAGTEWAHLDIAGTAWTEREAPDLAKGPTGLPSRIFVALAEALAAPA